MPEKKLYDLTVDPEFRDLIPPLNEEELVDARLHHLQVGKQRAHLLGGLMACVGVLRLKIIADGRVVGGGLHQLDVFLDLRGQAVAIAGEHALHVGLVARDDDLAVQGAGQDDDGHQQNRDGQHHSDEEEKASEPTLFDLLDQIK